MKNTVYSSRICRLGSSNPNDNIVAMSYRLHEVVSGAAELSEGEDIKELYGNLKYIIESWKEDCRHKMFDTVVKLLVQCAIDEYEKEARK